jgi:hypothetical protein
VSFESALAEHPAPRRLGDVTLRYEPSMLIGETAPVPRSLRPTVAWVAGVCALVATLGLFVLQAPLPAIFFGLLLGGGGLVTATRLTQHEARRRRFIANFATTSLRLDFVQPISGRPQTMVVHFDRVRDVALSQQVDGTHCLTVDFSPDDGAVLREVLSAFITDEQLGDADRLKRVLEGAFGLGAIPADSPALSLDVAEPGAGEPMA